MKTVIRDGKTILVFDDVEEMKWHFHVRLCKNAGDRTAKFMTDRYDDCSTHHNRALTVQEANEWLKTLIYEFFEVKE